MELGYNEFGYDKHVYNKHGYSKHCLIKKKTDEWFYMIYVGSKSQFSNAEIT